MGCSALDRFAGLINRNEYFIRSDHDSTDFYPVLHSWNAAALHRKMRTTEYNRKRKTNDSGLQSSEIPPA